MKSSFVRKLIYMGMALVLFAVILLVRGPIHGLRVTHQLSDATLGDVDPTSSTMVLVLGGLRGVAANLLWSQALEMQKEHDWTNLEVVVKSIVKLQPHFISIWTFQGWNLAYNVSVEWDQVSDKYYWIKQGIKFLRRGTEVNKDSAELRWDVGWTYFHKIGKADESALLRKLFRADDKPEIDAQGREQPPFNRDRLDNYKASRGWFQQSVEKLDELERRPKRMGEVAFRSYPAHAQTNSVQATEEEGNFGETIQSEWLRAFQDWVDFADHEFEYLERKKVKLDYTQDVFSDLYRAVTTMTRSYSLSQVAAKDWSEMDPAELIEHVRLVWSEKTTDELEKLGSEEKTKLKAEWSTQLWEMIESDAPRLIAEFGQPTVDILPKGAGELLQGMRSSFEKIKGLDGAKLASRGPEGEQARQQYASFATPAEKLGALCHEELYWCDRYATMINYRYWKERTAAEAEPETIAARRHFHTGMQRYISGDPLQAKQEFKQGLELWRKVLDRYRRVHDDDLTAEETVKIVDAYKAVLTQLDEPPLTDEETPFLEYYRKLSPPMPTPEQYNEMMRMYRQQQQMPQDEATKQEMMKMYRERMKLQPIGPEPPPSPPKSD